MKILEIVNPAELEGIEVIKCDIMLKSSWNHSKFVGVVINEEYCDGASPKIMTVEQMKSLCNNQPDIQFVNAKNYRDDIFKFVNKNIGFSININSDTKTKIISADCKEINHITGTPKLKIISEYSKGFRVSEDNEITAIDQFSDYELIKGLTEIIEKTKCSDYLLKATNPREMAAEIMNVFKLNSAEEMKVF